MSAVEVRTFTPRVSGSGAEAGADADTVAWTRAMLGAFLAPVPDAAALARVGARFEGDRLRAAHETGDPSPVGTLRSWDSRMTVPGGEVAVDAVTGIGIRSTHRRRGLLRALLTEDLTAAARAGTPVAALTSTQGSLYERFGFGLATWTRTTTLRTRDAVFRDPAPAGTVELLAPAQLAAVAAPVAERSRRRHPGSLARTARSWEPLATGRWLDEPDRTRTAVLWRDGAGRPAGYAVHGVEQGWAGGHGATVGVIDLQATTPDAYAGLWRHLAAHDLVDVVSWRDASLDEPLPWLLADHRGAAAGETHAMLWLRVLDPAALLAARTYPIADTVRLHVADPAGHAHGSVVLDTHDPLAPTVERLDPAAAVDATMPVTTLGSIYLGGADPRVLARAGRLEETTPGAAGRLARLLAAPSVPWNGVRF